MRKLFTFILLVLLVCGAGSGWFLVVDRPDKADVVLVLAGETNRRPARGLELLGQHYASHLILDVPAEAKIYRWSQPELAETYVKELPNAASISICPIHGLSTKEEAHEAANCIQRLGGQRVLLVTSDYHTRRAISIFRHEVPRSTYSVAAARDSHEFGVQWWRHREWAKTNLYECSRFLWWELIDRWR